MCAAGLEAAYLPIGLHFKGFLLLHLPTIFVIMDNVVRLKRLTNMSNKKKIAFGCLLGFTGIIFISIALTLSMLFGWRANVYEYSGAVEGYSRWHTGEYLLWHNGESFTMVYSLAEHPLDALGDDRGWVADFNRERIGRIRNLPVINPYRPDINRLRSAYIYEIEGLDAREWIYVLFNELRDYIDGIGLYEP